MNEEILGGEHLGCHRISPRKTNVGVLGQDMGFKEKDAPSVSNSQLRCESGWHWISLG